MTESRRNISASIHARLLNIAKDAGEDFEATLTRFALERLLHRLASSPYGEEFVLKGALLFATWADDPFRPTRDLDLLGRGTPDLDRLSNIFRDLCSITAPEEGVEYDASSLTARRIREDRFYEGCRVEFIARLGKARIRIQVDVGFGDAVTPPPQFVQFPTLLGHEPPRIKAYPRETVVAEKLEAMVNLGIGNSRMKDFFDICVLARRFSFEGTLLAEAIAATFERRGTFVPVSPPIALGDAFSSDSMKQVQWSAFLRRLSADHREALADFDEVVSELAGFLWPPLQAIAIGQPFRNRWRPGGPWVS